MSGWRCVISNKVQKLYDQIQQQLQGWITKATAPSQYENQQSADYNNIQSFLSGRDFRDPSKVGLDLLPKSEYQKQRTMLTGSMRGNKTLNGGRQQELSNDQFDSAYGHQYENQIAGLPNRALGLTSSLQNLYSGRMGMGLDGYQSALSGIANRPQGFDWLSLISQGLNAAGQMAGAFGGHGSPTPGAGSFTPGPTPAGSVL